MPQDVADIARAPRARDNRRGKRVLAVRAMAGETAWLEGALVWHGDRVAWRTERGLVTPSPADLALAQRRIYQIRRYPVASRIVLGDATAWLARRQELLERAKRVQSLTVPDLPRAARAAASGDATALRSLVALLEAEALCVNELPIPVSAILADLGDAARPALADLAGDDKFPVEARRLAALVLGALDRRDLALAPAATSTGFSDDGVRRCYAWGHAAGLPAAPALVSALLAAPGGEALAARHIAADHRQAAFALPTETLRDLLADGLSAERVVALAEAAAASESLAKRILEYRAELPGPTGRDRRAAAERLRAERADLLASLIAQVHALAQTTRDPAIFRHTARLGHALFAAGAGTPATVERLALALQLGGWSMAPERVATYLELLAERAAAADFADSRQELPGPAAALLESFQSADVYPTYQLIRAGADPEVVREAFELGIAGTLTYWGWTGNGWFRLALELARELTPDGEAPNAWAICELVASYPDLAAAREGLQPLRQVLARHPAMTRGRLLNVVTGIAFDQRATPATTLRRLSPFLERIAAYDAARESGYRLTSALAIGAIQLEHVAPQQTETWLEWLITEVAPSLHEPAGDYRMDESLRCAITLGAGLAGGRFERFTAIVRSLAWRRVDTPVDALERGLAALDRFENLRRLLAGRFPREPRRCIDVLMRLGLAGRLGPAALEPLAELDAALGEAPPQPWPAAWSRLPADAPELVPLAAQWLRVQRLRGGQEQLPSGVRHALEQPSRLSAELEHLSSLLSGQPDRADIARRVANLRLRLTNATALREQSVAEAAERLVNATGEAELAELEARLLACYRARLEQVAGPLPDDLALDDDLINATLLTVDARENRRLLRRLLRAWLAGDRDWPRRHPENARFLEGLAGRGVDVDAWLSSHPRRYRCGEAGAGRVHLRLERDTLRVLQMGNYFDTCLSLGETNAFSTVANACELNKRVIYATDGHGAVVGRKLIAIDEGGGLVGFRTYTSMSDQAGNARLRAIFRDYVTRFAACCRLELHDAGQVPTLFAQRWYDDGVVPWSEDVPRDSSSSG